MLFSQVKAREEAFVVDLPVEPTPTVTMDKRQVPLLEILQELEKQTGIFFSYESSLLDEFPKISFKAGRAHAHPLALLGGGLHGCGPCHRP